MQWRREKKSQSCIRTCRRLRYTLHDSLLLTHRHLHRFPGNVLVSVVATAIRGIVQAHFWWKFRGRLVLRHLGVINSIDYRKVVKLECVSNNLACTSIHFALIDWLVDWWWGGCGGVWLSVDNIVRARVMIYKYNVFKSGVSSVSCTWPQIKMVKL